MKFERTNDSTQEKLLNDKHEGLAPADKIKIQISDERWGFSISGTMFGVSDGHSFLTNIVPAKYFRNERNDEFNEEICQDVYAQYASSMVKELNATPESHFIEIESCPFYELAREALEKAGYTVNIIGEAKEFKQKLYEKYKEHLEEVTGKKVIYSREP